MFRTYINILIVFLISGLWHGADWSFVLWGMLHGVAMVVQRIAKSKKKQSSWHPALAWLCTFIFVSLAWVYFRAPDISTGTGLIKQLTHFEAAGVSPELINCFMSAEIAVIFRQFQLERYSRFVLVGFFVLSFFLILNCKNVSEISNNLRPKLVYAFLMSILFFWCIISFGSVSEFVYGAF